MKRKSSSMRLFLLVSLFVLCFPAFKAGATPCTIAHRTVEFNDYRYYYNESANVKEMLRMSKALNLKVKKSNAFKSFYATGHKIKVGMNKKPNLQKKRYLCVVENNGNKNFTYNGVKIGMTRKQVRKRMRIKPSSSSTKREELYEFVHLCHFQAYYNQSGKLIKWVYIDHLGPE